MNDREKWTIYSQALQRFLHFIETDRKPFKIPIVMEGVSQYNNESNNLIKSEVNKKEENENNETVTGDVTDTATPSSFNTPPGEINQEPMSITPSKILTILPKSYEKKTRTLLDYIVLSKPKIWWKPTGEVVINNQTIQESNIIDLVSDTVRCLKRPKPVGWEVFALLLKDIKVPRSCIGNPTNLAFINGSPSIERFTPSNSVKTRATSDKEHSTSTPLTTRSHKDSGKKIDWERWSPY